jgi:hypothetical protein
LNNDLRTLLSGSQIDLHVIKTELDSDHEMWPASSPNEGVRMEEQPAMFTFVSVNIKEVNECTIHIHGQWIIQHLKLP